MSKEILLVVDAVSNEKGVDKSVIFEAIESALASATRKKHGGDIDVRVSIHRETGDYETYRRWRVVDDEDPEFESPERQILYSYAIQNHPDIQVGEYIETPIESVEFGRIAAQTAKQVIVQKVREAERAKVVDEFQDRVGELVMGTVKRSERNGVFMDLGSNAEAFIPRDEMIARETVRPNDRLRGYLREVRTEQRGPQLFVSRTVPEFLVELFKLEVPEVGQGLIEIMGAARDPGMRAKIAVRSHDPRLDPVGACVGMRGSRVQSVSNELAGERIDIILWNENPAQFVINAMSPAEVLSIVVDEDSNSMDIAVSEEKLSQAIGRGGQNVRLASQLTGWELNVMSEKQAVEKNEHETAELQKMFMDSLDVDEEVAAILVQEGFSSIDEVAYVPTAEIVQIEEFDEDIVEELRRRARDALLTKAIASEEQQNGGAPAADLLEMDGMDSDLAHRLAARGICTMEDLAEQSVDDLVEQAAVDPEQAASLIMAARAPWFADQTKDA
ncbi:MULTISPECIES: transcription termination factor NusA [unclassified Ectothiorhodospira]|uniref:transcription termination factor NusA n=1 Tax=unclassified Ectothiorhodospira TaxID=2684909 RepID=UPI001EE94DF9|nr:MULTISPECIES: transcription termination factor NusA [unclassified Ectothiorhodospira]MCG5514888.1 transcription termination factor NusA [Ectothiorhodospira sp. 9100]MCG5517558.1 transcription termination factor NusA [Ectothiorhodospira sp. 9905]